MKYFVSITIGMIFSGCGFFIKRPIYIEKTFNQKEVIDSPFCFQDNLCNFLDVRINNESETILIALHGLGAHAGSFTFLQEYLGKQKISSIAIDFRGFGHWKYKRGDVKNIGMQVHDLHMIIQVVRNLHPNKKIILLGESLGSSLALWYSKIYPKIIDGLILTSIVTSNGSGDVRIETIFNLLISYIFSPSHPVELSYDPNMYSNDSTFVDWAFNIDTLGTRSISPRYLVQANRVIKRSYNYLCETDSPIMIIQGGKDVLSTKEKVTKIIDGCNKSNINYLYFPEMLHSIVNDKNRDAVFEKISEWTKKIPFE